MSRKDTEGQVVEKLDHAFELVLLLMSIITATMFQYAISQPTKVPPLFFESENVLKFLFIPMIVIVILWVHNQVTNRQNLKIFIRIYVWSFVLFEIFIELIIFAILCFPQHIQNPLVGFLFVGFFLISIIVPVIPFFFVNKILNTYKLAHELSSTQFFRTGMQYLAFVIAWATFWCIFILCL